MPEVDTTSDVAKLIIDGKQLDLPVIQGTESERAVDISALRKDTGLITLDEGYVNTGLDHQRHHVSGRRPRDSRVIGAIRSSRSPSTATLSKISYLLIYGELPTREQLAAISPSDPPPHDAARGHAVVLQRLSARRPPDGDSQSSVVGALVDVLSGFARSARSRAGRDFDPSADRQAADDRGLRLQEIDRPAVRLSAERPGLLRELPADDVRGAQRAVRGRSRLRRGARICC